MDQEKSKARTEAPAYRPLEGELWSLVRNILLQGVAQQQDYAAGKYASYEELSARIDAAAGERTSELVALIVRHGPAIGPSLKTHFL